MNRLTGLLTQAQVLKVNAVELERLGRLFDVNDVIPWLIEQRNMRCVAVTRGAAGSQLVAASGEVSDCAAVATTVCDTVGAGDAFSAVLLAGLVSGVSLSTVNAAANRYAAHVVSSSGATPAVPSAVVNNLWR